MTYHLLTKHCGSAEEALQVTPELVRRGGFRLEPAGLSMADAVMAATRVANASLNAPRYAEKLASELA